MGVKLLYFAWVREKTGLGEETVDLPDHVQSVADLMDWLKGRGPEYEAAFEKAEVIRAAINQTHVPHNASISEAREIAFFPPVTGG
ncbi:MAG: molybdopterin converting factor subunit 1 [Hyphomicrobiaceae bacterium]|nr:molybdopterin converting factor subunit 1 [Hyphomicrobiaceae bacterium]